MNEMKYVGPESFFTDRNCKIAQASNGFVVTFALPCRVRDVSDGEIAPFRAWTNAQFVYDEWPKARSAINSYFLASPKELVDMARTAFFEREAAVVVDIVREESE